MLKVNCEACGAPYDVDPRRIPASGLKMRCPGCGASFRVNPSPPSGSTTGVDLPAPKASPTSAGAFGGGRQASVARAHEIADLPAPKGRMAESLPENLADDLVDPGGAGADFDLDLPAPKHAHADLPAAKKSPLGLPSRAARLAPDFTSGASKDLEREPPKAPPSAPSRDLDLDLPAPKAGGFVPKKPGARILGTSPESAPEPRAKLAPPVAPLDLDLPAPKAQPAASAHERPEAPAPAALGELDLDLPAPKGGMSSFDLDLPAPKSGAFDLDLPAPKAGNMSELDLDLPAPKGRPQAGPKPAAASGAKSFGKPEPAAGGPAAQGKLAKPLAKDSLAIEPSPLFAGEKAAGGLGDLDDVHVAFQNMPQGTDLPAPSNLPAVKRPKPAGTMLGQGGPKLTKDSLDVPRGFAPESGPGFDAEPPAIDDLLPAPADLPAPKHARHATPLGELDLPAPSDLPVTKQPAPGAMLGHGTDGRRTPADGRGPARPTSASLEIGEMLDESLSDAPKGGFDLELDLPPPTARGADLSGPIMLEKLSLPTAEGGRKNPGFNATMALGAEDIELSDRGPEGRAMSLPGLSEADPFGSLGRPPSNQQTIELDGMLDFEHAEPRNAYGAGGSQGFGEVDFGLDNGPKTGGLPLIAPAPRPSEAPGFDLRGAEADLLGEEAHVPTEARPRKKRKAKKERKGVPGYVWPIALVLLIGGIGVGLGMFTDHGYFGVYMLEQLLPAAGDPAQVAAAIAQAEKIAKSDTYVDVRKSLVVLSDARNEAGLNRELLARSLLNEALYQLRFGDDAQSSQRSVAILARVLERGTDVKGLTLARAADAARRGDLSDAQKLLAETHDDRDPFQGLVAGEIALLQNQAEAAEKAFQASLALGGGARAQWGLTRALLARGEDQKAVESAEATMAASPAHAGALIFLARHAFAEGKNAEALTLVRKAAGVSQVNGVRARPSRQDRAEAWEIAGQVEERLDHPREAQAAYETALAADPLRPTSLIGSGNMLMRLGRARDALSRFESGLSAKPSATADATGEVPLIEATVGAVQALLLLERPAEAMPRIAALVPQFPENAEVRLWEGHVLEGLEKWEEAEAAFKKTIELSPDTFAGYVALSQLLFKRGRPEEGARVLADATGKVKDSAEVRRMLGYSELTRNHVPEAIHHFEAALRFAPNDAGALLGMTTAQRKNGNLDAAEESLKKLESVDPSFAGLPLERGQILESRGDYAAAAAAYRKALETRPEDTDLKLRLGAALVTAGKLTDAEAILPEVLKERPTSAEAEHFVGRLLLAKKETAQAVQHFERSIAFDPSQGEYHLYLAWAYLDQGNLGAALTSINKALERDPALGDARWILGRIQLRTGAVRDALGNFQQALKLKPGRVEALANMGDAYDQLRDLRSAIRAYQEAVQKVPENGDWWFRLGTLLLDKGSRDEARVALSEAVLRGDRLIEKPSWLADAHRLYAEVLRDGGRVGEALEHYRAFLELAPASHPDRNEVERIVRSGRP